MPTTVRRKLIYFRWSVTAIYFIASVDCTDNTDSAFNRQKTLNATTIRTFHCFAFSFPVSREDTNQGTDVLQFNRSEESSILVDEANSAPRFIPNVGNGPSNIECSGGHFSLGSDGDWPGSMPVLAEASPVGVMLLCGADLLQSFSVPGLWKDSDVSGHLFPGS